jgi:hypothetical protein
MWPPPLLPCFLINAYCRLFHWGVNGSMHIVNNSPTSSPETRVNKDTHPLLHVPSWFPQFHLYFHFIFSVLKGQLTEFHKNTLEYNVEINWDKRSYEGKGKLKEINDDFWDP